MNNAQLELSLHNHCTMRLPRDNRPPATYTSRWWFERMRQIVDRATDWEPAPLPRPEQTWFASAYRQPAVGSGTGKTRAQAADRPHQQQICE